MFSDQLASMTKHQSSFYTKDKQQDFKVFHNIPTSSQLLANYDPFYSPLLSRLDSVFKQLGYFAENCRERLVCEMYNNPAKFAPFSNLVSAQLSRYVRPSHRIIPHCSVSKFSIHVGILSNKI